MACLVVEWDGFFDQMVTYHSKDHGSFIGTCSCYDFCITIDAERQAKILTLPIIVHTVLEILSGYFGFIYFVDANNIYHHGSMYWIYVYYLEVVEKTDGLIGLLDRHSYKEAFRHQNEEAAVVMQDLTRRKLS